MDTKRDHLKQPVRAEEAELAINKQEKSCRLLSIRQATPRAVSSFEEECEAIAKADTLWPSWWNETFKQFYKQDGQFLKQAIKDKYKH